ncbi:hypothetical protein EG830_02580 [bacterium]|nr:hypothetical protein [bacterium]
MKLISGTATVLAVAVFFGLTSCNSDNNHNGKAGNGNNDSAGVNSEGIVLSIAEAELIEVDDKPQYNTAEWLFTVEKPGRYDVWLSSLTVDTTHLRFGDDVIITAGETKLEKLPVSDRVVTEDKSIKEPWFRADSHMGSVFFSKPGEYQVQVISDRVGQVASDLTQLSIAQHTLINSVILKPKVN